MDLRHLSPSPCSGLINLLVEIPAGSRNKYEYSSALGLMVLDRVLHSSVHYPFDYGFIPNTCAEDGSPLDAMVIMTEPTFAGCLIQSRPIGLLDLEVGSVRDPKRVLLLARAALGPPQAPWEDAAFVMERWAGERDGDELWRAVVLVESALQQRSRNPRDPFHFDRVECGRNRV